MDYQMQMETMQQSMSTGMIVLLSIVYLAIYVFWAYCFARIGKKTGMEFGSTFIWMLIPIVNFIMIILTWVAIAKNCGRPGWWGVVLCLVPIVNLILFLVLAFEEKPAVTASI